MKNVLKYGIVIVGAILWFSCNNDDDSTTVTVRDYDEVYAEDIAEIRGFLNSHYLDTSDNSIKVITGSETPISTMPELDSLSISRHDITYKVFYLNLNEGINESPCQVDSVYVSYKGKSLIYSEDDDEYTQTVFDERVTPLWLKLDETITGWAAVLPKFKAGDSSIDSEGVVEYTDFGQGIMFLPSGLAYFSSSQTNIPSYTPLIFNFSLKHQRHRDHDSDKVLSMYEIGSAEYVEPMDTDGDGTYDYLDIDDDGDGLITKFELTFDTDGNVIMPFADCNNNGVPNYLDTAPCN